MSARQLDVPELFRQLDVRRRRLELSWRDVGRETGICSSTFTRLGHGKTPSADALVTLLTWADLAVGDVVVES